MLHKLASQTFIIYFIWVLELLINPFTSPFSAAFPIPINVYFKLSPSSHVIHLLVQLLIQYYLLLLLCQGKWVHLLTVSLNFPPWTYTFIYTHTHCHPHSNISPPVPGKPLVLCPWAHVLCFPFSRSVGPNLWFDSAPSQSLPSFSLPLSICPLLISLSSHCNLTFAPQTAKSALINWLGAENGPSPDLLPHAALLLLKVLHLLGFMAMTSPHSPSHISSLSFIGSSLSTLWLLVSLNILFLDLLFYSTYSKVLQFPHAPRYLVLAHISPLSFNVAHPAALLKISARMSYTYLKPKGQDRFNHLPKHVPLSVRIGGSHPTWKLESSMSHLTPWPLDAGKYCQFFFPNICDTYPLLCIPLAFTIVQDCIISHLDYCNTS